MIRPLVRLCALASAATISFAQPVFAPGPIGALEIQTGYFPQAVRVTNPGPTNYPGLRVFVRDLPADIETNVIRVANAHGLTNLSSTNLNVPYFDFGPLSAGASIDFRVEWYISSRRIFPTPRFEGIAQTNSLPPLSVAFVTVTNATYFRDGRFFATFNTDRDRFYYVQYATNLTATNWLTSLPPIRGTGSGVIWLDSGPPRTQTPPGAEGSRFYRVIALPLD